MARLTPFQPEVRYIHGLQIYFRDKHSVVVSQGMICIIFHRWIMRPRGSYRKWHYFTRTLKHRNNLTSIHQIGQIAERYEVEHQTVTQTIRSLPPREIKVLPEHYDYGKKK